MRGISTWLHRERIASVIATLVGGILSLIGATTVFGELQDALDRIWRAPKKTQGRNPELTARATAVVRHDHGHRVFVDGVVDHGHMRVTAPTVPGFEPIVICEFFNGGCTPARSP